MLSDPVAEAFGLIHHHPSGENFWRVRGAWKLEEGEKKRERILMLTLKQVDVRLEYKARVQFALPYSWPNINWIVA